MTFVNGAIMVLIAKIVSNKNALVYISIYIDLRFL